MCQKRRKQNTYVSAIYFAQPIDFNGNLTLLKDLFAQHMFKKWHFIKYVTCTMLCISIENKETLIWGIYDVFLGAEYKCIMCQNTCHRTQRTHSLSLSVCVSCFPYTLLASKPFYPSTIVAKDKLIQHFPVALPSQFFLGRFSFLLVKKHQEVRTFFTNVSVGFSFVFIQICIFFPAFSFLIKSQWKNAWKKIPYLENAGMY